MQFTQAVHSLRAEYDLRALQVRRKGPGRVRFGSVVRPEEDVAAMFPDAGAVNEALRVLIRATRQEANGRSAPDSSDR